MAPLNLYKTVNNSDLWCISYITTGFSVHLIQFDVIWKFWVVYIVVDDKSQIKKKQNL